MTSRGSLAYYLAAWVCGSFFFSFARVLMQPTDEDFPRALLKSFFIMSALAWPALILFGLSLRLLTNVLSFQDAIRWTATGGVLAVFLGAVLLPLRSKAAMTLPSWLSFQAKLFNLSGFSDSSSGFGWKVNTLATALAGMATTYILFRINRAFAHREDASK